MNLPEIEISRFPYISRQSRKRPPLFDAGASWLLQKATEDQMSATRRILKTADALLADESTWTIRSYALDASTHGCHPEYAQARRWCALGAIKYSIVRAYPAMRDVPTQSLYAQSRNRLSRACNLLYGISSVSQVNDQLGFAAIKRAYAAAIASC